MNWTVLLEYFYIKPKVSLVRERSKNRVDRTHVEGRHPSSRDSARTPWRPLGPGDVPEGRRLPVSVCALYVN